jgi:hypothetical protein
LPIRDCAFHLEKQYVSATLPVLAWIVVGAGRHEFPPRFPTRVPGQAVIINSINMLSELARDLHWCPRGPASLGVMKKQTRQ